MSGGVSMATNLKDGDICRVDMNKVKAFSGYAESQRQILRKIVRE